MTYFNGGAVTKNGSIETGEGEDPEERSCLVLPSLKSFQTSEVLELLEDLTKEEVAQLANMNIHTLKKWEQDERGHKFSDGGLSLLESWLVDKITKAAAAAKIKLDVKFR